MLLFLKLDWEEKPDEDQISPSDFMLWFCLWSCLPVDSDNGQGLLSRPPEHDTCMAECISMEVISASSYSLSLPFFLLLSLAIILFVVRMIMTAIKEARWKEVSVLTSVHLSSPHFLCLFLSMWFHIPSLSWTMNRANHLHAIVFITPWLHSQGPIMKSCLCSFRSLICIFTCAALLLRKRRSFFLSI